MREYHVRGWILWCNQQCQGQTWNPTEVNSMLDMEYFDAIDNVKAKIQHKGIPWLILNTLMQWTMSRPKSNMREYHIRGWIFGCNQQCQGQNPIQVNTMLEAEYFDAIDNIKAKMQNKGLSLYGLNIMMQLTMSRPNPIWGNTMLEVEYFDAIDNVKAKIQHEGIPC